MTASTVIDEIKHLSPKEQAEVIRFTLQLARTRSLTGDELTVLAQRFAESRDPAEVERLRTAIVGGFYGEASNA